MTNNLHLFYHMIQVAGFCKLGEWHIRDQEGYDEGIAMFWGE